jgi:hypothetical protein
MNQNTTEGIAPKAAAGTIAALVGPLLADLLGVDSVALTALISAVLVFAGAWLAPPSGITGREHDDYEADEDQVPTYLMDRSDDEIPTQDHGDGHAVIETEEPA